MNKTGWNLNNTVLTYISPEFKYNTSIALFNFNKTLVTPKKRRLNFKDGNDWELCFTSTIKKLNKLHNDGCSFVIMSNLCGRSRDRENKIKSIISAFMKKIGVPFIVLFAMKKNFMLKPMTGMWAILSMYYKKQNIIIDKSKCIYVGNSAGRQQLDTIKADTSDTDLAFAHNIPIRFVLPEKFFKSKSHLRPVHFSSVIIPPEERLELFSINNMKAESNPKILKSLTSNTNADVYVIIIIGAPGSGKTQYAETLETKWNNHQFGQQYKVKKISADIKSRTLREVNNNLKQNISVIIDGNFPDKISREPYVSAAKKYNAPLYYIYIDTDIKICHLQSMANVFSKFDLSLMITPQMRYNIFKGKLDIPKDALKFYVNVNYKNNYYLLDARY